jgi:hypothetical protein
VNRDLPDGTAEQPRHREPANRIPDQRRRPAIGLRVLAVPQVPANAVQDCLLRLPVRQVVDRVGGLLLWLPRLGITVLPHEPVTGGWVCTLIAVDNGPPGWLPTGAFEVCDLEARTAIATRKPWMPTADLSVAEFGDAWQVRLACHHGVSLRIGVALLAGMDPDTLAVDVADPAIRGQAGCRNPGGFAQACRRLREAGLLRALFDDTTPHGPCAGACRYGLTLPLVPAAEWIGR